MEYRQLTLKSSKSVSSFLVVGFIGIFSISISLFLEPIRSGWNLNFLMYAHI